MTIAVIDSRTISDEARIARLLRRAVAPNLTPDTTVFARRELHALLKDGGVFDEWCERYRGGYVERGGTKNSPRKELTADAIGSLVWTVLKVMHSEYGRPLQPSALSYGLELSNDDLCLPLLEGRVFRYLEPKKPTLH